jgi:hypothetical protein
VGRCRKVKIEGGKGRERVVGKAARDEYVFIPGEGPGWQMKVGSQRSAEAVTGPPNRKA